MTRQIQLSRPAEQPHWHAMAAAVVLEQLRSQAEGLSERDASERLARYGPNVFRVAQTQSAWSVLAAQFRSVMVVLLLLAGSVALVAGDLVEAGAILAVLVLNVVIGFVTELRAHRAVEALLEMEVTHARVVREGRVRELDARELVPGDVIEIEAGQMVPADARLLQASELRTVEASLTGESVPSDKRAEAVLDAGEPLPERTTMLYKATSAVAGRARAVVVATGMKTEVGRIGELVSGVVEKRTPLERRLDTLGRRLVGVALGAAVLVIGLGYSQGMPARELFQMALALAVAAVPEGLPVVGTIAMAVGVRRMARRRALMRHLPVVETLGSATVICTDKTGTLTSGEMTVTVLRLDDQEILVEGAGYAPHGEFVRQARRIDPLTDSRLETALQICALTSRGDVIQRDGVWAAVGDPTEAALAALTRKAGLDQGALLREQPEIGEVPFSSERMLMATFHRSSPGTLVCVKGAPVRVLKLSNRVLGRQGIRELGQEERERLLEMNRELAGRGLRVLALAQREGSIAPVEEEVRDLTWVGLVGMTDPPAPGVKETVSAFRRAGIRTVMVTGDQRLTAERVAQDLGLSQPGDVILDGQKVDGLSDVELETEARHAVGYSRVSPEAKLRIISAYQSGDQIVAMLGDGVNDAAALRKADIGVAMGRRGTDMAKEASDLILEDDRFQTIAAAIEEGRVIFDNIRKFVFYLFSCNLGEILVLLGAGMMGLPPPLLPLQILWLNLLTDTVPALALAVEPGEPGIMDQPPRNPREAILSRRLTRSIFGYGLLIAACSLAAYAWGLERSSSEAEARTLAFMTLAFAQIFHLGNARSAGPVLQPARVVANRYALGAVALTIGLQLLALEIGPLAQVLRLEPIGRQGWLVIIGLSLVPAVAGQLLKTIGAGKEQHPPGWI